MRKIFLSLFIVFSMSIFSALSQEIATWKGFRSSAASFTFDDNCANQLTLAVPIFDKYGFPASFYLVTNWGPSWSTYKDLVTKGYEIGSHSDSHGQTMPDSEISSSKATIDANITNQVCNTITYPNCNEPSETELAKYYIGGRTCDGQVQGKTPSNYFRIGSIICGSTGSCNSASAFQSQMQTAINKNGWVVFLIHEVESGTGYSPTATSAIEGALSYASSNDSKVWVATFRDAILYSKERDAASLKSTGSSSTEMTFSLTDNLDNSVYNYPLSIRVPLPDGWSDVVVKQNDEEITSSVTGDYIYFDAVPDGGSIVLTSGSAVVPDPTFSFSNPTSAQSWCSDSSYAISWTMDGEASSTYSLNWNFGSSESSVSVSSATASSEWTTEDGSFSWSVDNILSDDGNNGETSRWGSVTNADEWVELSLSGTSMVGGVIIDEFEEYGTVSSFSIEYDDNGTWVNAYDGTTIGVNFSTTFTPVSTSKIRLYIKAATGVNINYFTVTGVSNLELKNNIAESGSYTWAIPSELKETSGTLSINKTSGKALTTSSEISITACKTKGDDENADDSTTCYVSPIGYTGPSCDGTGTGAYFTGEYRNLFSEYLGKTQSEVDTKISSIWDHFFGGGSNTVYYESGSDMAYIYDTGNSDVRTEGMSYGMMICVQLDHQEEFNKLWRWAKEYMQYKSGDMEGLFAWQCETNGSVIGSSCAPDGEAYFLTALFFASHRWGNDGDIDYETEAQYLIKKILDKPNRAAGSVSPIFNMDNHLITFGETSYGFTDPSYNLPGFLELWARWTDTNKDFWSQTAAAARDLLYNSSNSTTGLFPDYSQFDGTPYKPSWVSYESNYYKYDAIRCAMNVGMDYNWFGTDSRQTTMMTNLLNFFKKDDYTNGYFSVDGTAQGGNYSEGMAGANGVGAFALEDKELAEEYVNKLWNTSAPSGQWRYYNGMVYFLSMLHASGNFKIYKPSPEVRDTVVSGVDSVMFEGVSYTDSTNFCMIIDCNNYDVTINVEKGSGSGVNVETPESAESFAIVPNPANDQFSVLTEKEIVYIEIIDMTGQLVYKQIGSEAISVVSLSPGNYFVKVYTASGDVAIEKLLVY